MSSGCCSSSVCLCEESLIRSGAAQEETSDDEAPDTNMDIALLKQQYNSIKDKQKRETRVVYFKKAANNEEISGKSLVNVVPMRQVRHSLMRQASVQDTRFDFVRDSDSSLWRTHLGMYRRTCAAIDAKQQQSKDKTSTGDSASVSAGNGDHSVEMKDSNDQLPEDCEGVDGNRQQNDYGFEDSRKFSAPAVLLRQLSSGSSWSTHSTTSAHHYPFPQHKSPRKSEAARRLGLYSSF
ncbi:uncharacterized protein C9orf152 isoform X2 [Pygocentrus nattereri]|uniref:uncharacterized protein C9orf152 isoform X2 n=1 Tax=Pygocentrus nattereri TaxID=42514 RepID=UPI000814762D|nr:uncharacterized protein C9orf152 isoform X2 [Pygocentrus nattereri]